MQTLRSAKVGKLGPKITEMTNVKIRYAIARVMPRGSSLEIFANIKRLRGARSEASAKTSCHTACPGPKPEHFGV